MANENNNINELVADDDPTVELKTPTFADVDQNLSEVDAKTFDAEDDAAENLSELQADLKARDKTIDRLQFDNEQLQAKLLGLETENAARGEQTTKLHGEVSSLQDNLSRKEKLIKKRDSNIKTLKSEIRERDGEYRRLQSNYDDLQASVSEEPVSDQPEIEKEEVGRDTESAVELQRRLIRTEEYADEIRQQSQDIIESNALHEKAIENLTRSLADARQEKQGLNSELTSTTESLDELQSTLDTIQARHEEEIRTLRFELGEAQDTIVETGEVNSRLASDLVDALGFKDELEIMLEDAEEQSSDRISDLEKEIRKLKSQTENLERKLATKSEAISVLLEELTKKSEHIEAIAEAEDIVHIVDDAAIDETPGVDDTGRSKSVDRMTRVLVGTVDDQELRFPLFKNRLTIGRTVDNDIQLKAAYVSRRHAIIHTDDDKTRIVDWGSKNGIQVNSARVADQVLRHGDVLIIGNARFRYEERRKRDY